jgi:hypothetical protein
MPQGKRGSGKGYVKALEREDARDRGKARGAG